MFLMYNREHMDLMKKTIESALDTVIRGQEITIRTAKSLAPAAGADLIDLFSAAFRIRERFRGDSVDLCSIVNAKSGACTEDCAFCSQSAHHSTAAPVYPLINIDEIERAASEAKSHGAKRFCIVTSGRGIESPDDLRRIAEGVGRVRSIGLSPCATLGTVTADQLAYLRDAGLDRYHHNIETSRDYFPRVCTTHTFDERLDVLRHARAIGLSTCSGGILGMGETVEDRISMAFTLREINVDSVPINFLMPIPGTPLGRMTRLSPLESLLSIALFRFILPAKEIRICAGRGTAFGQLHPLILLAGADGFMIGNYLTTASGLDPEQDLIMIKNLGLSI